jgi:hypothetical protein
MKKVLHMKKRVNMVLRWLIIGAFALFSVLIVVGLIFEIFETPMSMHWQRLKDFLTVVGGITVLCLAYMGIRNLLLRLGLIKEKPYWLQRLEEDINEFRSLGPKQQWKEWLWFLVGFGVIFLLAMLLVWLGFL